METTSITCPHCGGAINVNELLYSQMHDLLSKEFNAKLSLERKALQKESRALEMEKEEMLKQRSDLDMSIASGVNKKLAAERSKLEKEIRGLITEEKSEELKSYRQQLDEKSKELKDQNRLKADFQKLQREKNELKEKIEAEAQERLTNLVEQERKKLKKELQDKSELKVAEKEHIIEELRKQLKEAQRKAEQGSVQLQGEVMEITMEDYLRKSFPLDAVEEIKKGAKGADSLQHINSNGGDCYGSIYYETKRTKDFQPKWIPKFKEDMQDRNATFGVLITEMLPKGADRMVLMEGVWVCSLDEAKGLSHVLREAAIMLYDSRLNQQDKGSKMEILYGYMTSNEFRRQVEGIVEGFSDMQQGLESEKRAMQSIWKQREKQIQKVLLNTTHIYSSVKGIAGNVIGNIKLLELNGENNNEKD